MKIIGDYHTHTDNSDGKNTIEDMIKAASDAELREVAITDHGHGKWFGGLKPKKYSMVKALIEKSGVENNIKTYFGIEANITGTQGQIDVKCEEDGKCVDILLCGVHRLVKPANLRSFFGFFIPNWFWGILHWTPKGRIKKNTQVVCKAIANNNIDIWTHPSRYFRVNVVEAAKLCAERGTLVELNGSRISFRPIDFERMAAVGAKFIINSDAHTTLRIAAVDKVFDFLKLCDYNENDIINLRGTFRRGEIKKIETIKEKSSAAENTESSAKTEKVNSKESGKDKREIIKARKLEKKNLKKQIKENNKKEKANKSNKVKEKK